MASRTRKAEAGAQAGIGQSVAKKKKAAEAKAGSADKAGKRRGRPARDSNVVAEEEADELSFTQPEVVPKATKRKDHQRTEPSNPVKKRGRPSRAQIERPIEDEADEHSTAQDKAQDYVQLASRTRRIARDVIETWPVVSPQIMDQILLTLGDAKKDIVNTQRDEQKAIAADETLRSMIRLLARQLSGSRIPPQAKDIHFNIDKLTERYGELFRDLTTERHSQQQLTEQVKVAHHLLQKDKEGLEQLKKNAGDWKTRWRQQEKQGRVRGRNNYRYDANVLQLHPLMTEMDGESYDDGPEDIALRPGRAMEVSMLDAPESELARHVEQLRRSLEDMQGNHEQVAGMEEGIRDTQVALDEVLFKHASAEQYAGL
jgi:hypothetical protein